MGKSVGVIIERRAQILPWTREWPAVSKEGKEDDDGHCSAFIGPGWVGEVAGAFTTAAMWLATRIGRRRRGNGHLHAGDREGWERKKKRISLVTVAASAFLLHFKIV